MKKILIILTFFISVLMITGCENNKKKMITADEFYKRVNERYALKDITSKVGYTKKAYLYDSGDLYFYFYEGNRSFDIGNIYIDETNNIGTSLLNKQDEITNGENFSSIKIWNEDEYYRIEYIDNTLLFAKTSYDNKQTVDDLFKKCDY